MPDNIPGALRSTLELTCPRCRKGKLFPHPNPYNIRQMEKMPDQCPDCGQDFVIEPGFYFGATYVSYALNVAWLIPTFVLIRFGLGLPYSYFVVVMFLLLPVLVPVIFRWSRSIWLRFFVKYDPKLAISVRQSPHDAS